MSNFYLELKMDLSQDERSQEIIRLQNKLIAFLLLLILIVSNLTILTTNSILGICLSIFLSILFYSLIIWGVRVKSPLIIGGYIFMASIMMIIVISSLAVIIDKVLPVSWQDGDLRIFLFLYGLFTALYIIIKIATIICSIQVYYLMRVENREYQKIEDLEETAHPETPYFSPETHHPKTPDPANSTYLHNNVSNHPYYGPSIYYDPQAQQNYPQGLPVFSSMR